jgi:hypothetical protein
MQSAGVKEKRNLESGVKSVKQVITGFLDNQEMNSETLDHLKAFYLIFNKHRVGPENKVWNASLLPARDVVTIDEARRHY